jgi:hypothetical protein
MQILSVLVEDNDVDPVLAALHVCPQVARWTDDKRFTLLHKACCFYPEEQGERRLQIIRALCETGADVNAERCPLPGDSHRTPTGRPLDMLGHYCYHIEIVLPVALILVEYGADASSWIEEPQVHGAWSRRRNALVARRRARISLMYCMWKRGAVRDVCIMTARDHELAKRFAWREWVNATPSKIIHTE